MRTWKNDTELFSTVKKKLFVALVGDILDQMGYENQFLSPNLKPISSDMVIIGRSMTVLEADSFSDSTNSKNEVLNNSFGLMFEALDNLKKNEIYICTGGFHNYALWGGLMSTRALKCGSNGAVLHGYHRDTNEIKKLDFPVISFGSYAKDQKGRGKVIDYRVPIMLDGVKIEDGDIVYGDLDGTLIIPKKVEEEVFIRALKKAKDEKLVLKALENGMTSVEAYKKFGVL